MTAPEFLDCGLDPAHILAVCADATGGSRSELARAVALPDSVRACLPSRLAARNACAVLARVGYQVDAASRGRDLLITGWSPAGLDSRLTAMRGILHQLASHPSVTARAVIEQYRHQPAGSPSPRAGQEILDQARAQLRAWVSARSGIHVPHDPAVQPADVGTALRLRATWTLEHTIDDLVERHLQVAAHALALYDSLSPQMSGDYARDTTIRRAGITFQLSGSADQDSTALLPGTVQPPGQGMPLASRPSRRPRALPGQPAVREFPAAAASGPVPPGQTRPPMDGPGGRHLPARRPRHPHC
jgi:hypothetical protein